MLLWGTASVAAGTCGAWAYTRAGAAGTDVLRDLAVGWSFAGAGLIARWRRPANRTGPLMLAEGLTWFLGNLQGTGVPVLFALGAWCEALNLAVLAHLVLAFPDGRLASTAHRVVVAAGYGLVAGGGLLRTLVYDPGADGSASYLDCRDCGPNALLLRSDPELFTAVDLVYRWLGALLTVVCVMALVRRWRASRRARRRVLLPAWVATAIAVAFVGWEVVYLLAPDALAAADSMLTLPSDLSQIAVPVTFLISLLRMRLVGASVGNLALEAGVDPTPRRLQDVLTNVLGDPSLRLGVRSSVEAGAWVDPDGRPFRLPPPGGDLGVLRVGSDEGPAAVLVHDAALDDQPELLAAVGAALGLCLRNAWLRSEAETNLREAAASRSRLAEATAFRSRLLQAAYEERRRLERDLHDGAQTRLVFALMTLRRVKVQLGTGGEERLRHTVAEADRALRQALDELRDLARGIHPAVLTREGLGPAISALADQAELPVLCVVDPGRYPPLIESTAYFTVCEALSNAAKHAGARSVGVSVRRVDERLVVDVTDDGSGGADPIGGSGLRGLSDRVASAGGTLLVSSPPGGGTRVRAELPCV
ncbi:sensor histidine kinase [Streptomyces hebeiensis]